MILDTIQRQIDFRDVTLACDDKQIQTHKSILLDLRVQFENYHHHHQAGASPGKIEGGAYGGFGYPTPPKK